MVFFELRWNYSPLKEKAVLLPDGLFIFSLSQSFASLHTATGSSSSCAEFPLLMQAARRASRPPGMVMRTKMSNRELEICATFFLLRPNPSTARKLLRYRADLQKNLTATNTAWCVHTRIPTYLGGYERSSFHDSTKSNASTGSGFLWFNHKHVGAKRQHH